MSNTTTYSYQLVTGLGNYFEAGDVFFEQSLECAKDDAMTALEIARAEKGFDKAIGFEIYAYNSKTDESETVYTYKLDN